MDNPFRFSCILEDDAFYNREMNGGGLTLPFLDSGGILAEPFKKNTKREAGYTQVEFHKNMGAIHVLISDYEWDKLFYIIR